MDYNYHTHTTRCHHAEGTDEEYIEAAIKAGMTHLGFSDHLPFMFPDGYESFYRVDMARGEEYVKTIKSLAEKYKDMYPPKPSSSRAGQGARDPGVLGESHLPELGKETGSGILGPRIFWK